MSFCCALTQDRPRSGTQQWGGRAGARVETAAGPASSCACQRADSPANFSPGEGLSQCSFVENGVLKFWLPDLLLTAQDADILSEIPAFLALFYGQLADSETALYLTAIDGLVAMATIAPEAVIPSLAAQLKYFFVIAVGHRFFSMYRHITDLQMHR